MKTLDASTRRALRAAAHSLHPVVTVGQHGVTPALLHELDVALMAHELVKVRVLGDDRDARASVLQTLCEAMDAAPVQQLGKVLVLWRPRGDDDEATPRRRARGDTRPADERPSKPRARGTQGTHGTRPASGTAAKGAAACGAAKPAGRAGGASSARRGAGTAGASAKDATPDVRPPRKPSEAARIRRGQATAEPFAQRRRAFDRGPGEASSGDFDAPSTPRRPRAGDTDRSRDAANRGGKGTATPPRTRGRWNETPPRAGGGQFPSPRTGGKGNAPAPRAGGKGGAKPPRGFEAGDARSARPPRGRGKAQPPREHGFADTSARGAAGKGSWATAKGGKAGKSPRTPSGGGAGKGTAPRVRRRRG